MLHVAVALRTASLDAQPTASSAATWSVASVDIGLGSRLWRALPWCMVQIGRVRLINAGPGRTRARVDMGARRLKAVASASTPGEIRMRAKNAHLGE